jgi:enoyl-CoA hydratase/carnithine racemase
MPGLRFGVVLGSLRLAAVIGADAAHKILTTQHTFEALEAARLGFVHRLAEPGSWPDIIRSSVDVQRLEPAPCWAPEGMLQAGPWWTPLPCLNSSTGSAPFDRRLPTLARNEYTEDNVDRLHLAKQGR